MKGKNPFSLNGFQFFGRDKELSAMNDSIKRGQSIVLYAPWGEGKTTLFNQCCIKYHYSSDYEIMRCNLIGTRNMKEFTLCLIEAMKPFTTDPKKEKLLKLLRQLRVSITMDPITGSPSFSLGIDTPFDSETTLDSIRQSIQSSNKNYLLYIDEYQQIEQYPDNNVEGILSSFFDSVPNLVCVFSGSHNRTIKRLLSDGMSPFYSRLTHLELSPLDCNDYSVFVVEQFKKNSITIDNDLVKGVYNLLEGSTFYMQRVFSAVYSKADPDSIITSKMVEEVIDDAILEEAAIYEYSFHDYGQRQKEILTNLAHNIQPDGRMYSRSVSGLLSKETISIKNGKYFFNNKFFRIWIMKQFPVNNSKGYSLDQLCGQKSVVAPIQNEDRERLKISLAYLTAIKWPRSHERALLIQLKEILSSSLNCPDTPRFQTIKKYLVGREEASLDSDMCQIIKEYINEIQAY